MYACMHVCMSGTPPTFPGPTKDMDGAGRQQVLFTFFQDRILLDPPLRDPPCAVQYAKLGYFIGQL